jgi:hypothetical protein
MTLDHFEAWYVHTLYRLRQLEPCAQMPKVTVLDGRPYKDTFQTHSVD